MFAIPIESTFESIQSCRKYDPKVTKMGVWSGLGTEWGPEHTKIPKREMDKLLKHDLWWEAEKCLQYGLVDEII